MSITDLPEKERLIQLSEECAELCQAAIKVVRAINGQTPVSEEEARKNMEEEIADVVVCIGVLCSDVMVEAIKEQIRFKVKRWEDRINGNLYG